MPPVDLFNLVVPVEQLHSDFAAVLKSDGYSPARAMINELFALYSDVDGTFVEQFQKNGFNSRLWELYLFAVLNELGFTIDRTHPSPDFHAINNRTQFFIEAVTSNPTESGPLVDPRQEQSWETLSPQKQMFQLQEFMAIKFGSPLYTKLSRRYWELQHVDEKPLMFAIADFTGGASMISSGTALLNYLYGYTHYWNKDDAGKLHIFPNQVEEHEFGPKKIPSGFFNLEGAEYVSAVITNPAATISKFNRIGVERGHRSPAIMLRAGTCYKHDNNAEAPNTFSYIVGATKYRETWRESLSIYHNPHALFPLEEDAFPGVAHHHLIDGQVHSSIPDFHTYGSVTQILQPKI